MLAQLETDVEEENKELQEAKETTLKFINNIEDTYLRMIFILRFIECMTWKEVKRDIGHKGPADSLGVKCHRYLEQSEIRSKQGL